MALKRLKIDSIFGGISPSQYFGGEGTYMDAAGIDPDLPIVSSNSLDVRTSGYVVPSGYGALLTGSDLTSNVVREITHPKDNLFWTVQSNGIIKVTKSDFTALTTIGTVAGSHATWAEYYNNYIYIFGTGSSKDDVSRVGPLNTLPYDNQTGNFTVGLTVTGGTSGATGIIIADVDGGATGTLTLSNISGLFADNETITDTSTGSATVNRALSSLIVDNVWKGATLGSLTALKNTKYPALRGVNLPNHVAHVHGDNSLYFLDFKDGQGLVHRINTTKVTNEGDTNGTTVPSAYNALDLPFGFYPTDIESYGTSLMIIGIYTTDTTINQGRSAFVLWDPTDTVSFYLGPVPLPDPLATAILNVNGIIHIWTGNAQNGVRLSRYLGGQSVQDVVYQEEGFPPFAGAVDACGNRVVWGGITSFGGGAVYAYGSKDSRLPQGLHCVMRTTSTSSSAIVTALKYVLQSSNSVPKLVVSWGTGAAWGTDIFSASATLNSIFRYLINVGQKFEIKKMIVPLGGTVGATVNISVSLLFDDNSSSKSLTTIQQANYSGKRKIVYRGAELKDTIAYNNVILQLQFTGTSPVPVALPITIDLDIKEDE